MSDKFKIKVDLSNQIEQPISGVGHASQQSISQSPTERRSSEASGILNASGTLKVFVQEANLGHGNIESDSVDNRSVEETKQLIVTDQDERIEPTNMIAQRIQIPSEDDEPFVSAMSKVVQKKQLSQPSEDELTNSDNSVGQEHDRQLSSGLNQYQSEQRVSSVPKTRSSATESLKLDSQSQKSRLKIFDLPLSQNMRKQLRKSPPKTSKVGGKSPNLKQYTPFMSIVNQKRLGASSVGNSQNNYKQAFHSMKNQVRSKNKQNISKAIRPSKAPLKPSTSNLKTSSANVKPAQRKSLNNNRQTLALSIKDYSRETSPEPTFFAGDLRCGSEILHPGKKPLKSKINQLAAQQRGFHVRQASRSDDEKASHNAYSGNSLRASKTTSLLNHYIPVALEKTPMNRILSRESPQAFFSKNKVQTQGDVGFLKTLNLHSFNKSDYSSTRGRALGSQSCKHELDQRPKQPRMASDHQSDIDMDIVEGEEGSKERQLYADIMNVRVLGSVDSGSPIDSANEALAEEKSNTSNTSMLQSMNLIYKSNPLLGYKTIGLRKDDKELKSNGKASFPNTGVFSGIRKESTETNGKLAMTRATVNPMDSSKLNKTRKYGISQTSQITQLKMPAMNLKFVSVNLFSSKLTNIDLSQNLLKTLPEELSDIYPLEHLKVDHNQLTRLPSQIWKISSLKTIIASNNNIQTLPENFEWLVNLETLQLNDNQLLYLPEKLGSLVNLRKLHVHENRLATLPREFSKLLNLVDFSIEWFMYTKPANSRVQKNPEVIKSVRDFCQNFRFTQNSFNRSGPQTENLQIVRNRKKSVSSELSFNEISQGLTDQNKYVSFIDFIIQYHKIPHYDLSMINKIEYTMKKRSLVHQVCFNIHIHLLRCLLNLPLDDQSAALQAYQQNSDTDSDGQALTEGEQEIGPPMTKGEQVVKPQQQPSGSLELGKLQLTADSMHQLPSAQELVAKVINLNKKDTQGVVPICLLIMNMSPIDKSREKQLQNKASSVSNGDQLAAMSKNPVEFFSVENSRAKNKLLNRRRRIMLYTLLNQKTPEGEMRVQINSVHTKSLVQAPEASPQPHQQQHPVLFWTVFKYQFKLTIELIQKYGADPAVLNNNNSNLLHILFANFSHDPEHAPGLADLLVEHKVSLNLIDKDGKSPLHVAIKKQQIQALQYIHDFNIKKKTQMNQSLFSPEHRKRQALELFDFGIRVRNGASPLHYVVRKSNYEAFTYLVEHQLADCLTRDLDQMTARHRSLINSAFYRILIKEEADQIRRFIQQREIFFMQKSLGQAGSGGLMNLMGENHTLLVNTTQREVNIKRFGPMMKIFQNHEEDEQMIQSMQKTYRSETSVTMAFDTVRSHSNKVKPSSTKVNGRLASGSSAVQKPMFKKLQSSKNIERKQFSFVPLPPGNQDLTDETVSVGSPRISITNMKFSDLPMPENVTSKISTNIGQNMKRHPGMSLEERHTKKLSFGDMTKRQITGGSPPPPDLHAVSQNQMDNVLSVNMLRHFIFSRRNIERRVGNSPANRDGYARITFEEETFDVQKQYGLQKAFKSQEDLEFTLGRGQIPKFEISQQSGNHAFKANLDQQVSARKGDIRSSIDADKLFFESSPSIHNFTKTKAGMYQQSASKIFRHTPSSGQMNKKLIESTQQFSIQDENTTRLLNIDSARNHCRSMGLNQLNEILDQDGKLIAENELAQRGAVSPLTEMVKVKSPSMRSVNHNSGSDSSDQQKVEVRKNYGTEIPKRVSLTLKNSPEVEGKQSLTAVKAQTKLRRKSAELKPSKKSQGMVAKSSKNFSNHVHHKSLQQQFGIQPQQLSEQPSDNVFDNKQYEVLQELSPKKALDMATTKKNEQVVLRQTHAHKSSYEAIFGSRKPESIENEQNHSIENPKILSNDSYPAPIALISPHFNNPAADENGQVFQFPQDSEVPLSPNSSNARTVVSNPDQPKEMIRPTAINRNYIPPQSNEPKQESSIADSQSNIFISNMNININLNINISYPPQLANESRTDNQPKNELQPQLLAEQTTRQEYLSTTYDDQNNLASGNKSRGDSASDLRTKTLQNSSNRIDENEAVKAAIDSMLESKAKEAQQTHILDNINTSHIAHAVSQQIQQQAQERLLSGQESCGTSSQQETANVIPDKSDSDVYGLNAVESKSPLPRSASGQAAHSENIDVSIAGNTPCKPAADASATKDKQLRFLQQMQHNTSIQEYRDHNPRRPDERSASPIAIGFVSNSGWQSPKFTMHDEEESLDGTTQKCERGVNFNARTRFLGGIVQKVGSGPYGLNRHSPDFAGSNDSLSNKRGSQYMHTEQVMGSTSNPRLENDTRRIYLDDDLPLQGTFATASCEGKLQTANTSNQYINNPGNTYTIGNKQDEQLMTVQSISQSNLILQTQTGLSEFNTMQGGVKNINDTNHPNGLSMNRIPSQFANFSTNSKEKPMFLEATLNSASPDKTGKVFKQLKENRFIGEFKLICDKGIPEWKKYQVLYHKLGSNLNISVSSKSGNTASQDAFLCLKLLADVLTYDQSPMLADIVNLLARHNLHRARNEAVVPLNTNLTQQREKMVSKRVVLYETNHSIIVFKRNLPSSKVSLINAYSIHLALQESLNAVAIHEIYKKIQLSKFPTVSKKLGQYLRSKRASNHDIQDIHQYNEPNTPQIPQSIQKRVKMSLNQKPPKMSPNSNESIQTPRDTAFSYRVTQGSQNINSKVPYTQPLLLASQMKQLNDVSSMSKLGMRGRPLMPNQEQAKHPQFFQKPLLRDKKQIEADLGILSELKQAQANQNSVTSPKGIFMQHPKKTGQSILFKNKSMQ